MKVICILLSIPNVIIANAQLLHLSLYLCQKYHDEIILVIFN